MAIGNRVAGLYRLDGVSSTGSVEKTKVALENKQCIDFSYRCNNVHISPDIALFHARLGHCSMSKLKHIDACKAPNIDVLPCDTCLMSKCHRLSFQRSESIALNPFDLVHMDLWGPYKTPDINGAHYFLTVLDDCTRATWTFLLQNKMQAVTQISRLIAYVRTHFDKPIKAI